MKKRQLPKPVLKKRFMKIGFWLLFGCCLFLSVVAIVRVGNSQAADTTVQKQPVQPKEEAENLATGVGAQTFAKRFTQMYFTWQPGQDGADERAINLKPYLANGVDEQAGTDIENISWASQVSDIAVVRVLETGKQSANLTIRLLQTFDKTITVETDEKESKDKKNKKKNEKSKKPKTKHLVRGPYVKYLVVPVQSDGAGFAVDGIPHLTSAPPQANISVEQESTKDLVTDSAIQKELLSFLGTFFRIYTTGSTKELHYYTTIQNLKPLTGVVQYKSLADLKIYPARGKHRYQVHVQAQMLGDQEKAFYWYPYKITVEKQGDRWLVIDFNNE